LMTERFDPSAWDNKKSVGFLCGTPDRQPSSRMIPQ